MAAAAAITVVFWAWWRRRRALGRLTLHALGNARQHEKSEEPKVDQGQQETDTSVPLAPQQEHPLTTMKLKFEQPTMCQSSCDVKVPHSPAEDQSGRRRSSIGPPTIPTLPLSSPQPGRRRSSMGPPTIPTLPLSGQRRRSSLGLWDAGMSSARKESARRKSIKRLSKEFLSYCLCDDDDDFWSVPSQDSEEFGTPPSSSRTDTGFFCLDGSDSENGGVGRCGAQELTLEDMFSFDLEQTDDQDSLELLEVFSFDLEKVADALSRGDALESLQDVIEKLMAANVESKTTQAGQPTVPELSPLMAGDLSGRMTPGTLTPTNGPSPKAAGPGACTKSQLEGLAKRLSGTPTPSRRQAQTPTRNPQLQSQLSAVVDEACMRNRQSLANAAAQEYRTQAEASSSSSKKEVTSAVRDCVIKSHQQHRQSLLQAAEIMELASVKEQSGLSEEWGAEHLTPAQLTTQLQMVQQAIQGARQRHQQSIASSFRSTEQLDPASYRGLMRSPNFE